jgi:ParB-like chromosome segregation protein Spo0J
MSKKPAHEDEGIQITSSGKFQMVPLTAIQIVERPEIHEESDVLFFNPRHLASFTQEKMDALAHSIRAEGLQQPPIVRAISNGRGISRIELIAGERRLRSCRLIFENDLPCFHEDAPQPSRYNIGDNVLHKGRFGVVAACNQDSVVVDFEADPINDAEQKLCNIEDVYPTISGSELYETVPCRVVHDCCDERALRLAFSENDKSEPLTISEEVALVERLERMGKKQDEIAEMLGSNVTWVSQTANFRRQLPDGAFDKLLTGQMARHVAVSFLSYPSEDRDSLFQASIEAERIETQQKIQAHQELKEQLEDEEDLQAAEADKAEAEGDHRKAKKARRKAATLAQKADKEAERLHRAKKESGTIKQGHVKDGASKTGILPKKAKPFDNDDIEETFVKGIIPYLDGDGVDEISGEYVPAELAAIVRRTALAILSRTRDPLHPIREFMIDSGKWVLSDSENEAESYDDEEQPEDDDFPHAAFTKDKGLDNEVTDFDAADDDDDLDHDNFEASMTEED